MNILKKTIKLIFSEYIISKLTGISYGWHGNYASWEIAQKKCTGYDENSILEKVLQNSLKVKNGEIPFEQDSVAFDKIKYSFPLLSALMWISVQKSNRFNILDFGGSLGTSYFQNAFFLKSLDVKWCIVEQQHFVKEGIVHFENKNLRFFNSIYDCVESYKIDLLLLSSVLPYMEKPYVILEEIISRGFEYILIDRTLFVDGVNDRLTIQKVPSKIYKASYCCWFLSESKFLSKFSNKYDLIYDFEIDGKINIASLYKGYLFRLRKITNP